MRILHSSSLIRIHELLKQRFAGSEKGRSSLQLPINILAVVKVKEDRRVGILEIEKHPVASGDAEREGVRKCFYLLDVQARIMPVRGEALFLHRIEPLDVFGRTRTCAIKVSGADDRHADFGGYCLIAFW